MQKVATKLLKKWLQLPRSTTLAVLFHPYIMNFPHLQSLRDKAVISLMSTISSSSDPLIKEISILLEDEPFHGRQSFPRNLLPILQAAKKSVESLNGIDLLGTPKRKACSKTAEHHVSKWNAQLEDLQVLLLLNPTAPCGIVLLVGFLLVDSPSC